MKQSEKPWRGKSDTKRIIVNHLCGKGFRLGYLLCRRAGLAPWCSVRLALQHGGD